MYLAYKEAPRAPGGAEGMLVAALAQASLRSCGNLYCFAQGEMSGQDVATTFARDLRDGAFVWLSVQGMLKLLAAGSGSTNALVSRGCELALRNPSPAIF